MSSPLSHLALRRPRVKAGGLCVRGRSPRQIGAHGLRLLQVLWRQDGREGRFVPQSRRDRGAGRLPPPDDLAQWLEALSKDEELTRRLDPERPGLAPPRIALDEKRFRWMLNEDQIATEKLTDGSCSRRI